MFSKKKLPDEDDGLGTSDPYLQVFLAENFAGEKEIGRTNTVENNENPDWTTELTVDFDRSKVQQLHLIVWDEDDLRRDDRVGRAWLNLIDYVDGGQVTEIPLDKQGYLTCRNADNKQAPVAPKVWADTQDISFKLSANNLPGKDNLGGIDPYVEIFVRDGVDGKETKIGRTATLTSTKTPQWGDTFKVKYEASKKQVLVARVWDNDNLQTDDKAGVGFVTLEDYIRRGQINTVGLSKGGSLTVQRADGLPAVPPTGTGSPSAPARGPTTRPTTTRPPFRSGSG